jgi:hypothetical protein
MGVAMDLKTQQLLQSFVHCANKSKLLPEDWHRFFDLAVHVHRHGVLMTGQGVRIHLIEGGFSAEASSRLGSVFELFCQLLTRYDQQRK